MKEHLITTKSKVLDKVVSDRGRVTNSDYLPSPILSSITTDSDLNSRRMAVVNLEAALACWKSIKNNEVSMISQEYRSRLSHTLRISPSRIGRLPDNLFRHSLEPGF
ncbi:MAG: hypothetical protein P8P49_12690 [Opitutales bacterium]|nr:hypothetical protein [Opitutales bacterium]